MKTCAIEGCASPAKYRGWCSLHYARWYRHGNPLTETRGRRGAGTNSQHGYVVITRDGKKCYEHIEIAERALGKPLPDGAEVHHVDGDGLNNTPSNLVICPDHAYHALLHRRQNALAACGNANYFRCWICGKWDQPSALKFHALRPEAYHASCWASYQIGLRLKRKAARQHQEGIAA